MWKDEGLVFGLSAETYIKRIVENFEREIGKGKENWEVRKYKSFILPQLGEVHNVTSKVIDGTANSF